MGRLLVLSILVSALLSSGLGCSRDKNEENVSGSIRVQVPFAIDGNYSLKIIELVTLENLVALRGLAARFLIDPDTVGGKLEGRSPELRYIRDNEGVIVPTDSLSLQLLTVYAHFEKMREMDQKLGINDKLVWPATVAINARYKTEDGTLVNNALYSGQYDALLMVPYVGQDLPIMVNGGVLAHEHFHNIFQKMVLDPLIAKSKKADEETVLPENLTIHDHDEKKLKDAFKLTDDTESLPVTTEDEPHDDAAVASRQMYHEVLMRGINEGLADVWGWVYSGDDSFVGRSLPREKSNRRLDVETGRIDSKALIKRQIDETANIEKLLGYSYFLGTQYARAIRNYASVLTKQGASPEQSRQQIGVLVLKVLPALVEQYQSLGKTELLGPEDFVEMFMNVSENLNAGKCQYFANLLPAGDRQQKADVRCEAIRNKQESSL